MTNTLLIDNYDSFTYNLYALIAEVSGAPPIVLRNDQIDWSVVQALNVGRVVISPGPGRPQRSLDLGMSADAISDGGLPVLGICLGHQAIGHLMGARVKEAREPVHGRVCQVIHQGTDLFKGLPSPFSAVRYHSLAVEDLPSDLEATAWAEDGTLMAMKHRSRPLWGIQFHPESICSEHGAQLLDRFLTLSRVKPLGRPSLAEPSPPGWAAGPKSLKLHVERVHSSLDPSASFDALYGASNNAFWLDSSQSGGKSGRFSYMGDTSGPHAEVVRYNALRGLVDVTTRDGQRSVRSDLLGYLEEQLELRRLCVTEAPSDFTCGYVGFFGYEVAQVLPRAQPEPNDTPGACWIFADRVVAFDHDNGVLWLLCLDSEEGMLAENQTWVAETARILSGSVEAKPGPRAELAPLIHDLQWTHAPSDYKELIRRAQALIREGETYEVCLTNQIRGSCTLEPLAIYQKLRQVNPAPYSAYFRVGSLAVLCSSPELFLQLSREREIRSKPIKGTAPRGANHAEDVQNAAELSSSVKNRAENLMIVDLLRNDMNRVCRAGSVHVPELFAVESYASVHQLVSTIAGTLRPETSVIDCVRSMFPGGSMTGAPKERTLAILRELEGRPRGVYSGSLGYLSVSGTAILNIVIRTMIIDGASLTIGAGGAITALSDPDEEYAEVVLKVRALLNTLAACGAQFSLDAVLSDRVTRSNS